MNNMLDRIQAQLPLLSKSERKVADVVLAAPEMAIHASIALLAQNAGVSDPTVNRFCHRLHTKGFPDFKLQLAQSLASGAARRDVTIEEHDAVEIYSDKIFHSALAGLQLVRQRLDMRAIQRAVELLAGAQKISFFGLGASAVVAHDAMNKFFRFNVPVFYSDDVMMQRMSCINSGAGDIVMLISHTGQTKSLPELARLARDNGAVVLALTASGSPLAQEASLLLPLDVPEDTEMAMPMVSRMAQLMLIDVLATGFTLHRGASFRDNLKRVKEALKPSRQSAQSDPLIARR